MVDDFFLARSWLSNSLRKKALEKTVWAWTDACGDGGGLAAVVFSKGNWYCIALVVLAGVTSQLLHRDDAQINFLEMFAVVLLVWTFGSLLSGKAVFCFNDNNSVLGCTIKGRCRATETNMLAEWLWLYAAQRAWVPFWARVRVEAQCNLG